MSIYLGSVALEINRWAPGKIPTYRVSDFLSRITADGFDGIELWANHYLLADETEQKRLRGCGQVAVFNSYVSFDSGLTEDLTTNAAAINALVPKAVKFNLGQRETTAVQTETLLRFADLLKPGVRLLCECHANTLMEVPETAAEVFSRLDERFGAIIHLTSTYENALSCFQCYGSRICHIHAANYQKTAFAPLEQASAHILRNYSLMRSMGFDGTVTLEFTPGDSAETMYRNAIGDLRWLRTNRIR